MYNEIIVSNFSDPEHIGEISSPDHEFEIGNSVCGDRIRVQLEIQEGKIGRAVFKAWGCATSVATANIFCSSINGALINDVAERKKHQIDKMLGELEPSQYHCLDVLHELHVKLTGDVT